MILILCMNTQVGPWDNRKEFEVALQNAGLM